jgi:hypothetical protein
MAANVKYVSLTNQPIIFPLFYIKYGGYKYRAIILSVVVYGCEM